jgi:monoamine oxidase
MPISHFQVHSHCSTQNNFSLPQEIIFDREVKKTPKMGNGRDSKKKLTKLSSLSDRQSSSKAARQKRARQRRDLAHRPGGREAIGKAITKRLANNARL